MSPALSGVVGVCAVLILAPCSEAQVASTENALAALGQPVALVDTATVIGPAERRGDDHPLFTWSLILSTALAQSADTHSTLKALGAGGGEGNPIVEPFTAHRSSLIAFKAGVAAATIFAINRLGKRHRTAAVLLMVAINSGYAAVAMHNYRLAARLTNSQ